ncbi:MAG TPA: glutamate-5-semialdehyde dehydrogenase [Phycisphaerae bacterium]|nr:glutamate-5-semialdehyde dehydrogenase [Phycisphaerae bacterium]
MIKVESIESLAQRARRAAADLAHLNTAVKNDVLLDLAGRIESDAFRIRQANEQDLAASKAADLGNAKLQRLELTDAGIRQMAAGLRQVAALDDPVGKITREYTAPSGILVRKVRCPIGVILMIYEARPNVTIDAFALCFKSGNACILKGGREALHSNLALMELVRQSLDAKGVTPDAAALLTTSDREELKALLKLDHYIDLVIPRGGTELIRFVHEQSRIPMVQHFHGVCHIFVDASADVDRAVDICATAKTSGPATCNAVECCLVHEKIAPAFVPKLAARLAKDGVELRGDETVCRLALTAIPATNDDWGREFLDLIVACKIVPDLDAAVEHIHHYGSNHTDAILSSDESNQRTFVERVQSSCTLVNTSTRFNDGFSLGLGAEIGISTSKVHAYGPMGLEELTTQRYVVHGQWHLR